MAVVGSLNMDLVLRARRAPEAGETVPGERFTPYPGGKGLNQAVAARRSGASVQLAGRVGDDPYGANLRALLDHEGIDQSGVLSDPAQGTGVAGIIVTANGENRIIVVPGANGALAPGDLLAARLQASDVLLLQGEVAPSVSLHAAQIVRGAGGRVVFNPAPVPPPSPELNALLAISDVVLVNRSEAAQLGGQEALGRRLHGALVLTLGEDGAILVPHGKEPERWPAFRVRVVDTTGAGDALAGALGAQLAAGRPLPDCLRWGMAAGALACTHPGAVPALPTAPAIRALVAAGP